MYLLVRWLRKLVLVACCSLCTSTGLLAENVNIDFKKNVSMRSNKVLLRDVASIVATNDLTRHKLLNLYIMKSPRIGYVESVTENNVKRILRRNVNLRNLKIKFTGAEKVFIHSVGKKYKYKKLIKMARSKLLAELISDKRDVILNFTRLDDSINLPFGELRFETRLNSAVISPRMCVWVDVFRKNDFYKSIPVWANVTIYEPAYLAKHYIEKHSVITESDFVVSRKNITELSGKHVVVDAFESELLVKKSIDLGGALRSDNVKQVPAVIAGTVLDAMVNEGAVSIQVKAVARKDAEIGEIVKVKSLQGGSILKTVVIGKQLVEVI